MIMVMSAKEIGSLRFKNLTKYVTHNLYGVKRYGLNFTNALIVCRIADAMLNNRFLKRSLYYLVQWVDVLVNSMLWVNLLHACAILSDG